MSGNKNPARKEKVGIHSAQSCMPLSSADFSRICTLVTKGRVWCADFIIIEEEIFLTVKWKNIIYDSDLQAEQKIETYLLVAFNTKICNRGETRSTHTKLRGTQLQNDLSASGASREYGYALRQGLQVKFIMTWKQDEVWRADWTSDLFNLSISVILVNHFSARQEPRRLRFTSYIKL